MNKKIKYLLFSFCFIIALYVLDNIDVYKSHATDHSTSGVSSISNPSYPSF